MSRSYQIVDADVHVNPPPTFWDQYLPAHMRDMAPKLEHADDADYVVFEGTRKKVNLMAAQGGRAAKDYNMEGRLSDTRTGGWMPGDRLADMDQDGMDVAVVFGGGPLATVNDDLYIESFRAYNRWLADFCSYAPDRFSGVAYIPMRDVDQTIGMIKEAAALGFTAVNIPAFPQSLEPLSSTGGGSAQALALTGDPNGPRSYEQPEFDPLWATAVDLDLAVTFHLGAKSPRFWDPKKFLMDMPQTKLAMAEPITILVHGAVFQRFPELKVATMESGVGWFAWLAGYMDATWQNQRFWTDSPLKELPSFYMDRNVYGSFIDEVAGINNRHLPGAKNIMWSSDYPHSETTFPHSQEVIERIFKGVPDADRAQILGGIARKLFRTGNGRAKPVSKSVAAE